MEVISRLRVGLLLGALVPATAHGQGPAQDPGANQPPTFQTEVVVTPERGETPRNLVPAATVVLDRETLAARPSVHPAEMVSLLPGFAVARPRFDSGQPVVSTRGFFGGGEAEYLVLLVDGVPLADAESGLADWSAVSSSAIQRIEAFRGPGASLYGDSAIGGVVHLLTNRSSPGGELTASGGSYGTLTADGAWNARRKSLAYGLSGAARRTGGALDHGAARHYSGGGRLERGSGGLSWRFTADGGWRRRDEPGSSSRDAFQRDPYGSDPVHRFDGVERRDGSSTFAVRHASSGWLPQARVSLAVRDEDLVRTILLAPGLGDRRARALRTTALRAALEGQHEFGAAREVVLRFGTDAAREGLDTRYHPVSSAGVVQDDVTSRIDGQRIRTGIFASSAWDAAPRVRVSGGIRWDTVDDGFDPAAGEAARAWTPRAGVTVQLNDARTLVAFGQVARAFKTPTLDQRFDPRPYPDFRGGTFTISNPRLVPQRATNVEAGILGGGPIRWSATAYRATVDNEIDFDVRTFSYANIGESRHTGVELDAEAAWGRLTPSISYAFSRVTTGGALQLKNVPRHRLRVAAGAELPHALHLYTRVDRAASAFLDDDNLIPLAVGTTVDLRIRRRFGRHAAFVDLFNATGRRYEEYGFTLQDFAGRVVPYVYPGAPRAIRAGMTVAF